MARTPKPLRLAQRRLRADIMYRNVRGRLTFGSGNDLIRLGRAYREALSADKPGHRGRVLRVWRTVRARLRKEGFV